MATESPPGREEGAPSVAITGAAGYIGSRVVDRLVEHHPNWEITALDNFYLGDVTSIRDIEVCDVDIRDRARLEDALEGADAVCHLAAISGVEDCDQNPDLTYDVNVTGTNNVAWFCRRTGTALVFPFSMAVLGDPETFPITADQPRDPMNWYGRSKLLGERSIETFADDAFPAHQFLLSNLYGDHVVNGRVVERSNVTTFFVNRAVDGEPLTVYEPGTQARNFVHVDDVAAAYVRSVERLLTALETGETGSETFEIGGEESPSVLAVAELVQRLAREELGIDVDIEFTENPRGNETLVEEFTVDTSSVHDALGWEPEQRMEDSIRTLLQRRG